MLRLDESDPVRRTDYLTAASLVKSEELARLILDTPEILADAEKLAMFPEFGDADSYRMAVLRYLSPFPYPLGRQMELMVRMMEAALCLIDWTVVLERVRAAKT